MTGKKILYIQLLDKVTIRGRDNDSEEDKVSQRLYNYPEYREGQNSYI